MNNYYKSGRYNRVLTQAYSYDKKKKELLKAISSDSLKKYLIPQKMI